jgi:protein-S-isoprenylcysteine O-methyltransferase Ste14
MENATLPRRALGRFAVILIVIAAILFLSAGSVRYWQGGVFLVLMAAFWIFSFIHLMKHDPQLLERRLQRKEVQPEQRLFQKLFSLLFFLGLVLPGLDFRSGWSRAWLGPMPVWLIIVGQALVVAGDCLVFWVMKTNSFAASTIQVETEQKVISRGPYAWVRHPMYSGMSVMMLATPLALGSYVALPVAALIIPLLMYRLIHEERVLRQELPGYAEYCGHTRFRLVPLVW